MPSAFLVKPELFTQSSSLKTGLCLCLSQSLPPLAYQTEKMRIATEDNISTRFELFMLSEGEKKVVEAADTRNSSGVNPDCIA